MKGGKHVPLVFHFRISLSLGKSSMCVGVRKKAYRRWLKGGIYEAHRNTTYQGRRHNY
ncbi:MAG: hypothetical protein U5N58_00405 [Actinomycetota bacterium]|nr:hypothetical protein [Actinomycetota bacterium]